ncbi:HTH domain-containing protein [Halocatena marina]|uniref:HTH domain-containing protein n=1 Tax=Halocatena marina TaxID=2934937 RepID=A0ABD5YR32_9EURY|nr:HTH domain-containing protein [Halocatena marina]
MPDRTDLTVVCYARTMYLAEPVDSRLTTLRQCATTGTIDALLFREWPPTIQLSDDGPTSEPREAIQRFRAWATREDVRLYLSFDEMTLRSTIVDEQRTVLRPPVVCLAFYVAGELAAVYPHTNGDSTHHILTVIETLRNGELPPRVATFASHEPVLLRTCPQCNDTCPTGHGIYACRSCRWVAGTTATGSYRRFPTIEAQWDSDSGSLPSDVGTSPPHRKR